MSRVLITGGFGYVGGRVAIALAAAGHEIRLASRSHRPAPSWLPAAKTIELDVLRESSCRAAADGVETVVHLAAVNEIESAADPARALQVNTAGTFTMLRAAQWVGAARFVCFSTAHVYGAPLTGHISEATVPRPVHPYAITHRGAEDYVLAAHDKSEMIGIVFRLSNGFGAPAYAAVDRWTLVVNDLCMQAVRERMLTLRSSGLQYRDFITLDDVGRAVLHVLALPRDACADGLFNLGGECSLTVLEMTERVAACCARTLGYEPAIVRPAPRPGEAADPLTFDVTKLKRTGFAPSGSADAEIDATLRLCAASVARPA